VLFIAGKDSPKHLLSLGRGMPALGVGQEEASFYTSSQLDLGVPLMTERRCLRSRRPSPKKYLGYVLCCISRILRIYGVASDVVVLI